MAKKHRFAISIVQETDGEVDGSTLIEEFSSDLPVHLLKTQVFTRNLTEAVSKSVEELTGMGLTAQTPKKTRK